MTREDPLTWEEWIWVRLLPLAVLLLLASSIIFGMAIAETSIATNGIAISVLTAALLTIFYGIFNIFSCLIPSFKPPHSTSLCVVHSVPIAIWVFLTMFELTEVKDVKNKANSYNSSYWGEGSGLSHGCSWADAGRYRNEGSYNRTCSLMKARFAISWVVLILLATIFFSFVFGPRRISDREKEERLQQARRDKGKGVKRQDVETGATEQATRGNNITPVPGS